MTVKIIILAGGKGTRLKEIAKNIPKPMVLINGKPVLEYQIELAKRYGYKEFCILTGYLGEQIENYFGDGAKWGVNIEYYQENSPLGTAGCVKEIANKLTEDFFVFYGDTIMDIALDEMLKFHQRHDAVGTLFLHPNDHPYDSDLVSVDNNGFVTNFYSKPHDTIYKRNLVNAALYILSPKILDQIEQGVFSDFGKHIFPKALQNGLSLAGYISTEYIKDMGTPDRYEKVKEDIMKGRVARLNKHNKRAAIFLDRDGVINKEVNLLCKPEQLELLPGAAEAIKLINNSEYLTVIITNQPVIARNLCDFKDLEIIHNKLETLLGEQRAFIDAIYFCPHHPDAGYPEERKEYKINCLCRKPKPGMLLQAAKDLNIDLVNSFFIGDSTIDVKAGNEVGCNTLLVNTGYGGNDKTVESKPNYICENILKAVELILTLNSPRGDNYDHIKNAI